jgi:threonine dehydratase
MEYSHTLSKMCGGEVWLKLENYQVTGSFKIRGATNKLLLLSEEEKQRGVITSSSGNHAQGIGYVAEKLGIQATIVVPKNTPQVKIDAIKRYPVELIVHGEEYLDAERLARKIEAEEGKVMVSPYNDLELIMGQGTVALEMIEEQPQLDTVVIPVGGGGLSSGISSVYKLATDAKIIGTQSVASPVMYECIKRGEIYEMPLMDSVAEGLHGGLEPGSVTFDLCKDQIDDWAILEEDSIVEAIRLMLFKHKMVVEGAAAVGPAAIMTYPEKFRGRKVGVVISGGNLDTEILKQLCSL